MVALIHATSTPPPQTVLGKKMRMGLVFLLLSAVQMLLESWARSAEDDFAQFHDLENTPGHLLMGLRVCLGLLFGLRLSLLLRQDPDPLSPSAKALRTLRMQGLLWFLSLPFLVTVTRYLPPYARHPLVTGASLFLQCFALCLMQHMFLDSKSTFFRVSALSMASGLDGAAGGGVLGLNAAIASAAPSLFKTKVATD
jgi:hypothetical protein